MPVPVRDSAVGEFEALLTKEMVPDAVPLLWGVKFRLKDALWPAARVNGSVTPLRVNSVLLEVADEMVTLEPVALRVTGRLFVVPIVTLLKFWLAGDSFKWAEAVPPPEREIESDGSEALDTTEMLPFTLPAPVGAKTAPKVKLCPGVRVSGMLRPLTLNPAPDALTWETVKLELPELVRVSGSVTLLPGCTLPKLRLNGLAPRRPAVIPLP